MPMTSLLDPAHCVSNNLQQTARAVNRIYAEAMQPAGLGRSQFSLLMHLHRQGPMSMTDIAERLYMDRTTLTRNLGPLERAGYVKRGSGDDARIKLVEITAAGKRKLRDAQKYWREAQGRILAAFGRTRWRELEATLRALREALP
jgi:DNA-binding MarR family transcriptional regulator